MCTGKVVLAALSGKCGVAFGGCGNRLSENRKRGCQRAEKGMYRSNSLQSDPACGNDGAVLQTGMVGSTACLSLTILFIYLDTQNRQITTDSLTGLNNRREFDKQIERWAEQHGRNWGMLMLDIDDFKSINDHMGHIAGDEALWETADLVKTCAR